MNESVSHGLTNLAITAAVVVVIVILWRLVPTYGLTISTSWVRVPGFAKKHYILTPVLTILGILIFFILLPEIKMATVWIGRAVAAGYNNAVYETPRSEYGLVFGSSHDQGAIKPRPRSENRNRYLLFVDTPRKKGWKDLPLEVNVNIPLDGMEHYSGLNIAFLEGWLQIDCPGHKSNDKFDLFVRGDQPNWVCLGESKKLPITQSGRANGELLVKGVQKKGCMASSGHMHLRASPLSGHHRIATTKVCEGGAIEDWGQIQVGTAEDSLPWRLYIRFADQYGMTLKDSVMHQKPGQIFLGVVEDDETLTEVFSEIVSQATNVYGSYIVPAQEKHPMLRIQIPDTGSQVVVEVILDIDNT